MQYKHSAAFYTVLYIVASMVLYYTYIGGDERVLPTVYAIPFMYSLTLLLNFFLYQSSTGRPSMMVNAVMLTSLGRLLGFGGVIVVSVFLARYAIVHSITSVAVLYLVSLGGDIFFVKRFKS